MLDSFHLGFFFVFKLTKIMKKTLKRLMSIDEAMHDAVCLCVCLYVCRQSYISETSETIAMKCDRKTESVIRMQHV